MIIIIIIIIIITTTTRTTTSKEKNCKIIDVAIPDDARVKEKEDEKTEKCKDLARELRRNIYGQK